MKTYWKRWVTWGGIGVVVAVVLGMALMPRPAPADFATVDRGTLIVTLDEEGETRVRDLFVVSAPLAGRVLRIELEPGDPVTAGESVLATFLPNDPSLLDARSRGEAQARVRAARASLETARAERTKAEAELDYARSELERSRRLSAEGIVSEEALDQAELSEETAARALDAADSRVRSAVHELERAQAALLEPGGSNQNTGGRTIVIRSPVEGTVLRRLRQSESVVPAGEPLIEVADSTDLEIVADYLSTDAVRIRPGQRVLIEQWGGDRPLPGHVRRVEPSGFTKISALGVEEQRVNVIIDLDEPPQQLGDGFRVEVRVVTYEREDVLRVPTSSLFRHEQDWAVFTVDGGRARLRPIEVGRRTGLLAEVLTGVEEGESVIVHPSDAIADGVRVAAR
jgi:HlyD family secretion protein